MTLTLQPDANIETLISEADQLLIVSLPIERTNSEINRITLKNAIRDTRAALDSVAEAQPKATILKTMEQLESHDAFLNPTYEGLAIVASLDNPSELVLHPLWQKPESAVSVGATPLVTPFLRNRPSQKVLLLHLCDNGVHLFRGHFGELAECPGPESLPKNFDEVIELERNAGLQSKHSFHDRSQAQGAGTVHGEGSDDKLALEFQRRYLRVIGNALKTYLYEGEVLLLAGVEGKLAMFRQENEELPMLDDEIHGNFGERFEFLRDRAKAILADHQRRHGLKRLQASFELSLDSVASEAPEIAQAVQDGRVSELFVNGERADVESRDDLILGALRTGAEVFIIDDPSWTEAVRATLRW